MQWLHLLLGLFVGLFAYLGVAQTTVTETMTVTITEVLLCTTTQLTTTTLDTCPCSFMFPSTTIATPCGASCCSTSTITSSASGPSESSQSTLSTTTLTPTPTDTNQFTIDLTVSLAAGDQIVTLSRIGNTIGIDGDPITFNISDAGELRDVLTGDFVFVILPSGKIRKRFQGSVDLLIGSNPPSTASTTAWRRSSEGDLIFRTGENSANPLDLSFGVYLTDDGEIDTSVPIQMYDASAGVPSDLEDAFGTQSVVTTTAPTSLPVVTVTRTGTSDFEVTVVPTGTGGTITVIDYTTINASTSNPISTPQLPTYNLTRWGNSTQVETTTANGTVYIITQLMHITITSTLYAQNATTSFLSFNQGNPTVTQIDFLSQYVTTEIRYGGGTFFTSTPTIGDLLPTLTAIAQLTQVTFTNTSFGLDSRTLSLQIDSKLATITEYIQLPATTTVTTTSYIFGIVTSTTTNYGTNPTATVTVFFPQVVLTSFTYAPDNFTITFGPGNPTATVYVGRNTYLTTTRITTVSWGATTTATSSYTDRPGNTLTVSVIQTYPPASYIMFAPPDNTAFSQYLIANATTAYNSATVWAAYTAPTSRCKFIRYGDYLILATDPVTGNMLPSPAYSFTLLPVATNNGARVFFGPSAAYSPIPNLSSSFLFWLTISTTQNIFLNQQSQNALANFSAGFYYELHPPGFNGAYTPLVLNTTFASSASAAGTPYRNIASTMFSLVTSAPTARKMHYLN